MGRSNAMKMEMPPVRYSSTRLGASVGPTGQSSPGGLDLTTPGLSLQPGALRDALNFECAQSGGYARIDGYERYDGRPAPSAATFIVVQVSSFTNVPSVGAAITQASSGASGTVAAVVNVVGGTYMVVTQTAGIFDASGAVMSGATAIGTATAQTVALSGLLNAQYQAAAADVYRALIGAVPGSGAVLGVVGIAFGGVDCVFAFRANMAGTSVLLYKASVSGWTLVPFFNTVAFTSGGGIAYPPADGETLTQGGVTATIKRVMWQSGGWAVSGGSAVGTFVVVNPTGGNFAAGAATTTSGATVTLSGAQVPITLAAGGYFEMVKCNFSGQIATRRVYGCDGVNKSFEFDGTTLAPITTGLSPDAPSHIAFHQNYLILAQASSLLYCGVGTPFKWGSVDGGGEIATGDIVTCMLTLPGSQTTATLGVYCRSNTSFLYGTDPTTFKFVTFNTGLGALPHSVQNLFDTFAFDDLGIITLRTTLNWGNFLPSKLTANILPFIIQERTKLIASSVMRSKSQYRVFFSDGYGLYLTMVNQQYLGIAPVLFPNPVFCCDEGETLTGVEVTYFGSSDGLGYVYQMDTGPSFDGANLDAHITMAWDPIKSPRMLKRFRAASVEMQGGGYAAIQFGYQLGYSSTLIGQSGQVSATTSFSPAVWDAFTWDGFFWDGQTLAPTDVDVTGTAENIQVIIGSTTNYIQSYTLNSIIHHYTPRRGIRV